MILVDDNDQEIGQKLKRDRVVSDIYRVSALWIKNSRGESLLARRGFNKRTDPGVWGPAVAGTVEIGETYDVILSKRRKKNWGSKIFLRFAWKNTALLCRTTIILPNGMPWSWINRQKILK